MTSKTIAVFTSENILNTEANQKQILQALYDGMYFKDLDFGFIVLEIVFNDFESTNSKAVEVRITSLKHLSSLWCDGTLEESIDRDYLNFINFEMVVDFNLSEI